LLVNPEIITNQSKVTALARERSQLEEAVLRGREYISIVEQIEDDKEMLAGNDPDLKNIAQEELPGLEAQLVKLGDALKTILLPRDPNEDKNIIVEIRAGTGGEEAALFVSDLYRMYTRYAERKLWKYEIMDTNPTGIGGLKEIIFSIIGKGAYGNMQFESGVHRVQRVPKTEASGRIHTSAATVAVLPEAQEADIDVRNEDLKIDTYRASGAGGQHVNKTESAIRLAQERAEERKSLVSTGDRSAKIRTYNFPQGRITDHRINYTSYHLEQMLDGDLMDLIEQLRLSDQQSQLIAE